MDATKTEDWLDLFTLMLETASEMVDDPKKSYERMGISQGEIDRGEAPLPGKRDPEAYRLTLASWKNVCRGLKLFGIALGDMVHLEPKPEVLKSSMWNSRPWIQVSHGGQDSIRFEGHEAMVALSFFHFYVDKCRSIDPSAYIRQTLTEQGISKENFRQRLAGTSIANPWELSTPEPKKNIIQGNFSLPESTP
jgi:hypothetical protein